LKKNGMPKRKIEHRVIPRETDGEFVAHQEEVLEKLRESLRSGRSRTVHGRATRSAAQGNSTTNPRNVGFLVQTPYIRLLAPASVDVALVSKFAGKVGPIVHYTTARVITGRAGVYPRRYLSDEVDHESGSLARRGNRRLRQVLILK
jgi:Transposase IS116/IS110/IS902 family